MSFLVHDNERKGENVVYEQYAPSKSIIISFVPHLGMDFFFCKSGERTKKGLEMILTKKDRIASSSPGRRFWLK